MIPLYDHQIEFMNDLRAAMRRKKSILAVAPTGFGKTQVAAHMIEAALSKGSTTCMAVPRRNLLTQTHNSLTGFGIHHSFVAAGRGYNPFSKCYLASTETLKNRLALISPNVLIIDEVHFGESSLDKIIKHYRAHGAWIIGLSATPCKTSGKGLCCWFEEMVEGKQIGWLIENGYLSQYEAYAPSHPDLSSLRMTGGDYNKADVAGYMETHNVLIGDAVKSYKAHAMGLLNITYCTSIKHSEMTAAAFNEAGIPSAHVDGTTPDDELRRIISAYARRELLNLCNAQLLNFGFDLAQSSGLDVTIESMSDLDPTKSIAKQMQKNGRVLRRKDRPAIINDHANNINEHGLPCDERAWTLADRKISKRTTERTEPVRQCPKCYFVHRPALTCPHCGHVYEIKSRMLEEIDGELKPIDKAALRQHREIEQAKAQTLEQLIELGRARGYKPGWAIRIYEARKAKKG